MRNTMASRNAERREPVTRGTGNVFEDLGFPDAAERQAKLRLAYALNQVLEERKLSQADAAKVLGVTQPKVSALRHYKLAGFSLERLMNLLMALDQDVEIVIRRKPRSRKAGRISVVAPCHRGASPASVRRRDFHHGLSTLPKDFRRIDATRGTRAGSRRVPRRLRGLPPRK